jgi:chemotaxis protein methyltransferase CheR
MLNEAEFLRIRDLIYAASGISFEANNRSVLESRLRSRLRKLDIETLAAYIALVESDEGEMRALLDHVTTNLTRFFRNGAHMNMLRATVIPQLGKAGHVVSAGTVHAWSAGCSTGEEVYTIAMLFAEHLPPGIEYDVVGSDLSLSSVMTASSGFYPEGRMEGVPEPYLSKYFEKKRDGYQVVPEIKKRVRFDYSNLTHDSGLTGMDVILCRNVLIYFDAAAQEKVVSLLYAASMDPGYLFVGHSESLLGMTTDYEYLKTDDAVIYCKGGHPAAAGERT